jgi:hypothetical protein
VNAGRRSRWIFASPRVGGKQPFWPEIVLQKIIRPAALRAGIRIGRWVGLGVIADNLINMGRWLALRPA